jgi:hypothetical protein
MRSPCINGTNHELHSIAFKKEMRKPDVCYITR